MYVLGCLLMLVSAALGQILLTGECNYGAIGGFVTDINVTQITGNWHQIARIDNGVEQGECSSATFTSKRDGNGTLVGVEASFMEVFNKTKISHNGTLEAVPNVDGLLFANVPGFLEGDFVVQATNYSDYAILYACYTLTPENTTANLPATKLVLAWQYHRKSSLEGVELAALKAFADINPDLNGTEWRWISHNDTACGRNGAVAAAAPRLLLLLAALFLSEHLRSRIM